MVPVGDVTFETVPETWVANNGSWAHMGIALKAGSVTANGAPEATITEDLLASVFGIEATVARTHHGLQITPVESLSTWESEKDS